MSYPRWICLTTALTLIFTTGGLWLEARLKGEPAAAAKANAQTQKVQTEVITATIQVLITGAVQKPGIYSLPAGSSIQTLLELAGGSLPEARLSALDLNRAVGSGEVLHVPAAPAENTPENTAESATAAEAAQPRENTRTSTTSKTSKAKTFSGKISLNRAGLQELEHLPGVGPSLAKRILEWRQAHGGFKKIEDLLEVKGIGPKKFEKMRQVLSL